MARPVPRLARYTLRHQWPAVLLEGATVGFVSLAPFVVKRSLGAGAAIVPLLITIWQTSWIFAPAVAPVLARHDPQRSWRRIALLSHLPLLLVGLVWVEPTGSGGSGTGNLALFLCALSLYYGAGVASLTHRGALLRANYAPEVRGRLWGLLQTVTILATVAAAKTGGWLLDHDPRTLRVIFPCAAVLGYVGFFRLGRIRWRRQRRALLGASGGDGPLRAILGAMRETVRILREDKAFRTFQIAFMLYGFAFLMSWALLVLLAEESLRLSYSDWTWAQGFAFPLSQIAGMALFGRIYDRIGVVRTTALSYGMLFVFLLWVPHVAGATDLAFAYALFGMSMSGVNLGWGLGPPHFAPEGKAHIYTAAHLSCVGFRSLFAPFLGYGLEALFSTKVAFAVAAALMALGAATMLRAWHSPHRSHAS